MASYSKKSNGKFRVRWRTLNGSERTRTVPTRAVAKTLVAEIEEAKARGRDWQPAKPRQIPLLRELMAVYLEERAATLSDATVLLRGAILEQFVRWAEATYGDARADLLSRRTLSRWYAHLLAPAPSGRTRAQSTANQYVSTVSTAWAWLFDRDDELRGGAWEGLIPRHRRPELPRKRVRAPVRAPTWAEMDALIAELDGWGRRLAIVMRCTGLRSGAACALTWEEVDLDKAWLRVPSGITKGGYGGRAVPLSPNLVAELRTWRPMVGLLVPGAPPAEQARQRTDVFTRAWTRAGVDRVIWHRRTTHALRKGFASGLRQAGADSDAVDYLLGHSLRAMRGPYLDPAIALNLTAAVALVPPLSVTG